MVAANGLRYGSFIPKATANLPALSPFVLNGNTDAVQWIVSAQEAGTITRLYHRQSAIVGTTPTFRISAQGINLSTGHADGTILGAGNSAFVNFNPSSLSWANEGHWLNLGGSFDVTRAQRFSIVIDYVSGTIDGSNSYAPVLGLAETTVGGLPYVNQVNAGSVARSSVFPIVGFGTTSTAYGFPINNFANVTYASNTVGGDEYAIKFNFPAALYPTYTIAGLRIGSINQAAGSFEIRLYDSASNILQQTAYDADVLFSLSAGRDTYLPFDTTTLATLTGGLDYRLSIIPMTANNIVVPRLSVLSAGDFGPYFEGTTYTSHSVREDGGSWTDDPLIRIAGQLVFGDITIGQVGLSRGILPRGLSRVG